jgi:hypothetical protein
MKRLLLLTFTIMNTIEILALPREDLRWLYEQAFGHEATEMADSVAELLKNCSNKYGTYDARSCEEGEKLFNHAVDVFQKKASKISSLRLDDAVAIDSFLKNTSEAACWSVIDNSDEIIGKVYKKTPEWEIINREGIREQVKGVDVPVFVIIKREDLKQRLINS